MRYWQPIWVIGISLLTIALSLLFVISPLSGMATFVITIAILLAIKYPEWLVGIVALLTLAGSHFVVLATIGYLLAAIGGTVSAYVLASRKEFLELLRYQQLPFLLILILAIRFSFESNWPALLDIFKLLTVVLLVINAARSKRMILVMGITSFFFALLVLTIGVYNETQTRLEGFSGNPNRMVFGSLMLLPFSIYCAIYFRKRALFSLLFVCNIVLNLWLIYLSQSQQGFFGLVILFLGLSAIVVYKINSKLSVLIFSLIAIVIFVVLLSTSFIENLSSDTLTLSGRTDLFEAAFTEIQSNFFSGSGNTQITLSEAEGRSTHSAFLTLFLTAGVFAAIVWLFILIKIVKTGILEIKALNVLGTLPFLFLAEQSVQAVALQPLSWIVITYFLSTKRYQNG